MPMRKIRKPRYLGAAVIALASAVAVALVPGAAAAQTTPDHYTYRSSPYQQSIVAPCIDETIELTTTISGTFTGFIQPGGLMKETGQITITGEGEGSLGNHYRTSMTAHYVGVYAPGSPSVSTETWDLRFIGEGDAPDLLVRAIDRMTVNANGERAVYFSYYSSECM